MANHASAIKRHRQSLKRRDQNRHVRATIRNLAKKINHLVAEGKATDAQPLLAVISKRIDQAVSKGVYHRKTGSRYISRLTSKVSNKAA